MRSKDTGGGRSRISGDEPTHRAHGVHQVVTDAEPPVEVVVGGMLVGGMLVDEGEIGRGGTATVHRALDPSLRRRVAVKTLSDDLAANPRALRDFIQEAEITAQLEHPNIIPIHELAVGPSGASFSMRLIRGQTLLQAINAWSNLPDDAEALYRILNVFLHVCDAVAFAHSRGVIHGDIKPANVMVGSYGEVYLVDWGIASLIPTSTGEEPVSLSSERHTRSGVRGTPAFMAPEQAKGVLEAIDERTDVFGLGALLYFILCGHPPFAGTTSGETLTRARAGLYPDPERSDRGKSMPALCRIVRRAMSTAPADRHASVVALQEDVRGFLNVGLHFPSRTFAAGLRHRARGRSGRGGVHHHDRHVCREQARRPRRKDAARARAAGARRGVRRDRDPVADATHGDGDGGRRGDGEDRDARPHRGTARAEHLAGAVRARARRPVPRGRRQGPGAVAADAPRGSGVKPACRGAITTLPWHA